MTHSQNLTISKVGQPFLNLYELDTVLFFKCIHHGKTRFECFLTKFLKLSNIYDFDGKDFERTIFNNFYEFIIQINMCQLSIHEYIA